MDPVPMLQQEIDSMINKLHSSLGNRDDMLNEPRGGNIEVFNTIGISMLNNITSIRESLNDIEQSIRVVRQNFNDYNITETLLLQRENYVKERRREVDTIEQGIALQNEKKTNLIKSPMNSESNNMNYRDGKEALTLLDNTTLLENLHRDTIAQMHISQSIVSSLQDDEKLLDDLSNDMDNVQNSMKNLTRRISRLIEQEGRTSTYIVIILAIAFLFLLFMLV